MKAKGEVEALKTIIDFKTKPLAMLRGQTPGLRLDPPTALRRLPVVRRKGACPVWRRGGDTFDKNPAPLTHGGTQDDNQRLLEATVARGTVVETRGLSPGVAAGWNWDATPV